MAEIIPIDNDRASEKLPIHIETIPEAFPERFQIRFQWNYIIEKWVMEIEHREIEERVVKSMVSPYFPYWYQSFILFSLIDPSGESDEVTPQNLGDDVMLFAFPGPAGQSGDS